MASAQHELTFGEMALVPANPSGLPFEVNTLAELDFGNPEPRTAPILSALLDGSLAEVLSHNNRDIVIRVQISGPTLADVSVGERALMAEVGGRNTLTWQPPDGFSEPTVFDVIWSKFEWTFDDLDEAMRQTRTFVLTLNCAPFGRDDELTVVEAIATGEAPPSPVTETVDDCTSATGWAVGSNWPSAPLVGPTVTSGGVQVATSGTGRSFNYFYWLTRTGLSANMATTPYLVVDAPVSGSMLLAGGVTFEINGSPMTPIAQKGQVYYFDCAGMTVTSVQVRHLIRTSKTAVTTHSGLIRVLDISRTNMPPFVGTGRMQFRRFTVGGSARTEASLALAHETSALGEVRIYTNGATNSGYQPPIRQYRNAAFGDATPDVDMSSVSGARSMLDAATPETFDIPASAIIAGTHLLEVLIKGAVGYKTINYSVSTLVGAAELGTVTGSAIVELLTTDWQFAPLAALPLPPVALPEGSSSKVRVKIWSASAVELDEAFVFNTDVGRLTGVVCGTGSPTAGGASSRVWVDTPRLDWPNPAIWLGTQEDRSDARHAVGGQPADGGEVPAQGTHVFEPGDVNLLTVSTAVTNVAASLSYYRRHQHNRAD